MTRSLWRRTLETGTSSSWLDYTRRANSLWCGLLPSLRNFDSSNPRYLGQLLTKIRSGDSWEHHQPIHATYRKGAKRERGCTQRQPWCLQYHVATSKVTGFFLRPFVPFSSPRELAFGCRVAFSFLRRAPTHDRSRAPTIVGAPALKLPLVVAIRSCHRRPSRRTRGHGYIRPLEVRGDVDVEVRLERQLKGADRLDNGHLHLHHSLGTSRDRLDNGHLHHSPGTSLASGLAAPADRLCRRALAP